MEIGQKQVRSDLGQMNQRIQFKMPLKGRNSTTNEQVKTYVTSSAVWANVAYSTRSSEDEVAARKTDLTYVTFTMYFREAVRPTWRILYRDAEFEIESVLPDQHRQFMKVEAVQREPWRDDYWVSPEDGFFTDVNGNYWVVTQRGTLETQPTFGNLTWTGPAGGTWTTT